MTHLIIPLIVIIIALVLIKLDTNENGWDYNIMPIMIILCALIILAIYAGYFLF